MPDNNTSSGEFAALCQSQITLLSKSLGAVWSVIYLTEEISEDGQPQLFPFAIYPQDKSNNVSKLPAVKLSEVWQQLQTPLMNQLLHRDLKQNNLNDRDPSTSSLEDTELNNSGSSAEPKSGNSSKSQLRTGSSERKQLFLPLIHQEAFIGLLATGREDRDWQPTELAQIEEIAHTIAIARFLELQYHWAEEKLAVQKNLRRIEHDRLDDLFHQLRNPLTALRTFGKLLLKRLVPGDSNRKIAESLLLQGDRFQELLQQFETESAKLKLPEPNPSQPSLNPTLAGSNTVMQSNFLLPGSSEELNSVELQEILLPLVHTAQAIALDREINLISNLPQSIPPVRGDFSALREIFNNLLDNALKYTPAGGKVQLDWKIQQLRQQKMLGIAIQDTGYGIPSQDQERIFERHYRGVQADSDIPGTGLGLAIAQELVLKMQGKIVLISPNRLAKNSPGTTFAVWLPMAIDN